MSNIKDDLLNFRAQIEKAREELYIIKMTNKENVPKSLCSDKRKQKKIIRQAKVKITLKLKEYRKNKEK